MPACVQQFARQVEAADGGVLVEVAQDVGQLQRAAEMMRELDAGLLLHAEDPHRQAADGASHAVAVEVERREIGRTDIGLDIHLHAVDHGQEIVLLQAEIAHRALQEGAWPAGTAGVESVEIVAPPSARAARARRAAALPSSAMSSTSAAEHVDREHRLALGRRHDAHGGVEGAAGNLRCRTAAASDAGGAVIADCRASRVGGAEHPAEAAAVTPRAPRSASAKASTWQMMDTLATADRAASGKRQIFAPAPG